MFFDTVADLISLYVRLLERILRNVRIRFRGVRIGPLEFELKQSADSSYAATIEKIEKTRAHLHDAISAVDTLKSEIQRKKAELDTLLDSIRMRSEEKLTLDQEREVAKKLLSEDAAKVRDVLGIQEIRLSRTHKVVGFFGGVLASLLAAGIWALMTYLLKE
jgi:hypothetical protein